MSSATNEPGDDFEAAKAVFEKLKDLSRERQERVLRWVAEGLGVGNSNRAAVPDRTSSGAAALGAPAAPQQAGTPVATDIKSFVTSKSPRSDQQFATAVAYYYRFDAPPAQRKDTINVSILQEATRLVGRKRLTNPKSTLNNAKNQGYLDSTVPGEFSINTVGENLVAMALPGGDAATQVKKRTKKSAKKRRSKK